MTIQRYTGENVEFHATGDLVAYEDYAELKEEYERLDKAHSAALAKIDRLAAENAALKAYIDGKCLIMNPDGLGDVMDADSANVDTPTTDAILASLRTESMADGVIALADKVKSLPYFVGVKQQFIRNFAAQLRSKSEVQS